MGESPRWHDGRLWVCDWVAGEVLVVRRRGRPRGRADASTGLPFSIDWLPDGRAVLTTPERRRASRRRTSRRTARPGSRWNEIVVDAAGQHVRQRDGFDCMGGEEPKPGTSRVVRPDGRHAEVADDVWFPNGMAVTPDGATLIVAESYAHRLTAFDIDGRRRRSPTGGSGPTSATARPGRHLPRCRRARSGTPTCPTGAASAWPRAARCSTRRRRPRLLRVHARRRRPERAARTSGARPGSEATPSTGAVLPRPASVDLDAGRLVAAGCCVFTGSPGSRRAVGRRPVSRSSVRVHWRAGSTPAPCPHVSRRCRNVH